MPTRRRNFILALILFAAWVGALGWMATVSGERPRPRPAAGNSR